MRKPIIMGNWKMHGSTDIVQNLCSRLNIELKNLTKAEVAVFPPFAYLNTAKDILSGSIVQVGAQDVSMHKAGAYTGEVSADMLVDISCKYVLVGHSERRTYHKESNELVANKFVACMNAGLIPVLCVGETLAERENNEAESLVSAQLQAVLELVTPEQMQNSIIAYEPVWAIGTGVTATPDQAQAMHKFIRECLGLWDKQVQADMRIVYGGSVKPGNAADLFALADVDGGLIGGASLIADDFIAIANVVSVV